ncbi:hypothetical protein HpCK35_31080 [Helicobacter pylori]|nr:hypothetical protein [Campylobacter jejuni]ELU7403827.1 hypothetical protein [Campylobacter jejuni]VEJ46955.1 Uncharacterised protein [Campylobacter jejuni subsp. doylei]VTX81458.1 Uncharacterised protein [Campylobacter jejuni]
MFYPPIAMKQNYFFAFVWQDNKTNNSFFGIRIINTQNDKERKNIQEFLTKKVDNIHFTQNEWSYEYDNIKIEPFLKISEQETQKIEKYIKEKEKLLQINKHLKDFPKP